VLLFTGFGFTPDKDHVRLLLSTSGVSNLQRLRGSVVHGDHIDGTIRTPTLQEDFVIFDFKKTKPMKCNSVDIPRADIVGIREDP
jgi:hypothetical protein